MAFAASTIANFGFKAAIEALSLPASSIPKFASVVLQDWANFGIGRWR
jgi:hypothetical protein